MNNKSLILGVVGLSVVSAFLLGIVISRGHLTTQNLKADIVSTLFQQDPVTGSATTTASSSKVLTSPLPLGTSATSPIYFSSVTRKLQYKMFFNIDPCALENLTIDGWQIMQIGSVTTLPNSGFDSNCQTRTFMGIDWAILQRER